MQPPKTARLQALIRDPRLLVMPAVYDAMSARIAERAGFAALQCSGLCIAASLGYPDMGLLSLSEVVNATRNICRAVQLPVMADADDGYGNALNVWRSVQEFASIGAAGVNLEDQVFPKRCGEMSGIRLVSRAQMVEKICAAREACADAPDFVINARTDALTEQGIGEVIERGTAYLEAGATMCFVSGVKSVAQIKTLVAELPGPLALNMAEEPGALCEAVGFAELEALGVARVSLSLTPMLAAVKGMSTALNRIVQQQATRFDPALHASFDELRALAGQDEFVSRADRFVAQATDQTETASV